MSTCNHPARRPDGLCRTCEEMDAPLAHSLYPAPFTPQWNARMTEAKRKLGEAMREVERLDWQRRNMPRLT